MGQQGRDAFLSRFAQREPVYREFSHIIIQDFSSPEATVQRSLQNWRDSYEIFSYQRSESEPAWFQRPEIYGKSGYDALISRIRESAASMNVEVECMQSNHEGAIIDAIHKAKGSF